MIVIKNCVTIEVEGHYIRDKKICSLIEFCWKQYDEVTAITELAFETLSCE